MEGLKIFVGEGSVCFMQPVIPHSSAWADTSPVASHGLVRGADDVTRSGLSYAINVWGGCTGTPALWLGKAKPGTAEYPSHAQ